MILELDSNVLDLVKQRGFYPDEYMSNFEKLKKNCPEKKGFIVPWRVKKLATKSMNMFLKFEINLKWKRWKIIRTCT